VPSPVRPIDAIAIAVFKGGATVGTAYEVTLVKHSADTTRVEEGHVVWSSYKVEPIDLHWRGGDSLDVVVEAGERTLAHRTSIHMRSRDHIVVRTVERTVPNPIPD
jgi:hypothetical protein